MDNKRSRGVTFWGFLFIIVAVCVIPTALLENKLGFKIFDIILFIIYLILGINILQLKEWSRKTIIYFNIFLILIGVLGILSPLFRMDKLFNQEEIKGISMWTYLICRHALTVLSSLLVIYFFTRPKVKEQFK